MRHVLVPLDGSELSVQALPVLLPLASSDPPQVTLLRVRTPEGEAEDPAAELEAAREALAALGFTASARIESGDPAERILSCAAELGVDLILMLSHGRSGLTRLVRGSVAERVLRGATAPLLLCTPRSTAVRDRGGSTVRRILVPLDGSALAEQVLPLVEQLALAHGAEVTLLRVEGALDAPPSPVFQPGRWTPERTAKILEPLTAPRDRLAQAGVAVERHVAYGNPADQILALANQFDLVALTSHGRAGVSRWVFGSVAEAVLRRASCPLLVQRVSEAPPNQPA